MPHRISPTPQLKIAAINVNSIITHLRRLELLQFLRDHNHDAVLLSETKLNASYKLTFKGYTLIRRDKPNTIQGDGTAILVKRGLPFEEVFLPSASSTEILESTVIKIPTGNNKTLFLASVYVRSDCRVLFTDEFDQLFRGFNLSRDNHYYVIAGDLNARRIALGNRANNQRGSQIPNWETSHGCEYKLNIIPPAFPTYKPAHTFLGICFADQTSPHQRLRGEGSYHPLRQ